MIRMLSSRKSLLYSITSLNLRQLCSTGIPCTPHCCADLLNSFNKSNAISARLKTCIERAKELVPRVCGLELILGTAPRAVRCSRTVQTVQNP